jgi:EAL domain-containing protein (putative c-di-GMP-specific phosphodiesterase class I)
MHDTAYATTVISKLKQMGYKLSIDDFGTGYSSLSHLKMLQIDELKIDKSFIDHIVTDTTDQAITKAIIEMSKTLELTTVAEGIETTQQLDIITTLGCDIVQGYYFSKPLTIKDFNKKYLS